MKTRTISASVLALTAVLGCKQGHETTKGVGDELQAFVIQNCADSEKYCQVCRYSGKPTVFAVGDVQDKAFEGDLARIQSLVEANRGLTAFALVGKLNGKGGLDPLPDEKGTLEKLDATRKRLGLTYPLVIVPSEISEKQKRNYRPFNDAYRIEKSRTLLFARSDNKITFTAVVEDKTAEQTYKKLTDAVKASL